ncbi:MAG: HAD family hydrolase [Anaerobutyricum sp.]|nr:HAD family hydrolase [Anaerobutyricum sp.]
MTKLVVTDVDSTLVPDGASQLNPEYYFIIERLREKGITFAVASGRHSSSIKKLFHPVLDQIWVASQNGNVIETNKSTKILQSIPFEWIVEFLEDLSKYTHAEYILDTAHHSFCPYANTDMYHILKDDYKYDLSIIGEWLNIPKETYSLLTIYHPNAEKLLQEPFLRDKWQKRMTLTLSGKIWIICSMPDVSKGNALKYICNQLDISPKESIAFGDNYNDIPMIQAAGTGYAVDNGRPETQSAADKVISGFHSEGVLKELKKLL